MRIRQVCLHRLSRLGSWAAILGLAGIRLVHLAASCDGFVAWKTKIFLRLQQKQDRIQEINRNGFARTHPRRPVAGKTFPQTNVDGVECSRPTSRSRRTWRLDVLVPRTGSTSVVGHTYGTATTSAPCSSWQRKQWILGNLQQHYDIVVVVERVFGQGFA